MIFSYKKKITLLNNFKINFNLFEKKYILPMEFELNIKRFVIFAILASLIPTSHSNMVNEEVR
jgi:hypothetical protein